MSKYTNIDSVKNYVEIARRRLIELGFIELKEARILVEWNTRAYNRLGQCCPRRDYYGKRYFVLNFNKMYFEVGEDKNAEGTMIHEVAHCVNNGLNHVHDGGWYKAVTKYNQVYGTNIVRCSFDQNYANYLKDLKTKNEPNSGYRIFCSCCNRVVKTYQRNCKAVHGIRVDPNSWRCGGCGRTGTLKLLN